MKQSKKNVLEDSGFKAYVLQQVNEIEVFLADISIGNEADEEVEGEEVEPAKESKGATITVEEKNVKQMIKKLKKDEQVPEDFSANFCYLISVAQNGNTISAYGLADDQFETLRMAKERVLKQLHSIADQTISNQDHLEEITHYLSGNTSIH